VDQKTLKNHYKFVVIGGGIVGAGILRDLALHKQDVLLLEKGDFSSQTSQGSSKMLHGGIRYLENFDFALVFEALREKKLWLKLSSHIAWEDRFYLPVYKNSKWPLFFLRIGLFLYDLLSLFKNPPFKILSKNEALKGIPGLKEDGLTGAGLYSDGIIDDSKLVFDLIFDSIERGASAFNYHELTKLTKLAEHYELKIVDHRTGKNHTITGDYVLFAVGPFTDQVLNKLQVPWQNIILPSKGSHIWIKQDSLKLKDAMVLQTKDNRIIFVIPQRGAILVGTTEIAISADEDMFNIKPTKSEIQYLIDNLNDYFPKAQINLSHVIASFAAVRPLVKSSTSTSSSKTSRRHKIYKPLENLYVIAGGKYTTFRVMAQDLCQKIFKDAGLHYNKKLSLSSFVKTSLVSDVNKIQITKNLLDDIIKNEAPLNAEDLLLRRLSLYSPQMYSSADELEKLINECSFTNDKTNQQ
jgi:glycerol-3-phosphate dehydrogenase